MRRCKLYQRDVVLVRVGVSEGAMVDDQGPGQGDKAAGDGNGKQGELEVGIHLGIGGGIKPQWNDNRFIEAVSPLC